MFLIFVYKYEENMEKIIGRKEEIKILQSVLDSKKSEFVAVYGRRRVGKTFLIRNVLEGNLTFQVTGMGNVSLMQQLINFHVALQNQQPDNQIPQVDNWLMSFQQLINFLEKHPSEKKVIFIDELPWFDTKGSGFIQALEHFWNSWASARNDIKLITCGSAASWMINKLINNKGGLHNRITKRIRIIPFTLNECEQFIQNNESVLDRYQIIQLYMVLGGIPFYWNEVSASESAAQNINRICFTENGGLRKEFSNLFSSLFYNSEKHLMIARALATKAKGLIREDILTITKLPNAGSTTKILEELEESGFIRKYIPFGKKSKNSLYQLVDFYTLFYLKFMEGTSILDKDYWLNAIDNPQQRTWSGYAFEQVCLYHQQQIKQGLGISGIQTHTSSWRSTSSENGSQVDLVIDRRDQVVNLCEMKYSINQFIIDKKYAEELRNKIGTFKYETKTRKSVFLTLITTFGLQQNNHSAGLVQSSLTMDVLFNE
jgi:uncharacterized protein